MFNDSINNKHYFDKGKKTFEKAKSETMLKQA